MDSLRVITRCSVLLKRNAGFAHSFSRVSSKTVNIPVAKWSGHGEPRRVAAGLCKG